MSIVTSHNRGRPGSTHSPYVNRNSVDECKSRSLRNLYFALRILRVCFTSLNTQKGAVDVREPSRSYGSRTGRDQGPGQRDREVTGRQRNDRLSLRSHARKRERDRKSVV